MLEVERPTLERFGFRRRSCHEPSQYKCNVKFLCLKPNFILVNLELLLILLVLRDSGKLSETGVNQTVLKIEGILCLYMTLTIFASLHPGLNGDL